VAEGGNILQRDVGGIAAVDLAPSREVLLMMYAAHEKSQARQQLEQRAVAAAGGAAFFKRRSLPNLREPSLRLVDYVAVLAFDVQSKQTTVDWRFPLTDHKDFAFDPHAAIFAVAPEAQLTRAAAAADKDTHNAGGGSYFVHTSIINRRVRCCCCCCYCYCCCCRCICCCCCRGGCPRLGPSRTRH
jgi:hypothetical protein